VSAPVPPGIIFVEADEPLLVYPSIAEAENCLEAVDVEGGLYPGAYGGAGELYRIRCVGGRVVIERAEGRRPDALKELLIRYFEGCEDPADAGETLDVLVGRAWTLEQDYRSRCGSSGERFRMPIWGYLLLVAAPAAILYFTIG
jgi:hypothetical protein